MGRIGKIIKSFIQKIPGSSALAQFSEVEEFAGDNRTYQSYGPCNEDFAPPEKVKTLNENVGRDAGFIVTHSYKNEQIEPIAIHGERRIYSTNKAGDTVKSEAHFKQDGTIFIDNGKVTITAHPSGLLEIETDANTEITSGADFILYTTGNSEITSAKTIINNDVEINGNLDVTGNVTADGNVTGKTDVKFGPSEKSTNTHTHTDVEPGTENTGGPA